MSTTDTCENRCWYYKGKDPTFQCLILHIDRVRQECPCKECIMIMICTKRCTSRLDFWSINKEEINEYLDNNLIPTNTRR